MLLSDLRRRILEDSRVFGGGIVNVDSFLNHQLDVDLCCQIGLTLANQFRECRPTVVITVEASGIVPAFLVAQNLGVRMIIIRKKKSLVMEESYISTTSFSHTKREPIHLYLNKEYLHSDDRVLMIDDFLANGNVALSVTELIKKQNATMVGAGFVIEKSYLPGRLLLAKNSDIKIYSLLRIEKLEGNRIILKEDPDNLESEL